MIYGVLIGPLPLVVAVIFLLLIYYAHKQNRDNDKFASRSRRCIFVGYPYKKKVGDCMMLKVGTSLCQEMLILWKMNFHLKLLMIQRLILVM